MTVRRRPSAAAVLLLALGAAGCSSVPGGDRAGPPGDVIGRSSLPQYHKDDTWAYAVAGEEVVEKVIDITGDGTVLWAATDGRRWESFSDPLLPAVRSMPEAGPQTVRRFTPPTLPDLTLFPLQPGKSVAYRTDLASADDGRMERAVEHTCEVRGPRQVTVPAGSFTAVEVFCQRGGRFETMYYSPDVRNTVMELRDVDGHMEKKELMAYRPAADADAAPTVPEPAQVTSATAAPLAGAPSPTTAAVERESLDQPAQTSAPAATPEPTVETAAPAAGGWTLQLAALSSQEAARAAWGRWQGKVTGVLPGAEPHIAEGGGLWRLSVGGFSDRAAAGKACARLQAAGVQCFPKEG